MPNMTLTTNQSHLVQNTSQQCQDFIKDVSTLFALAPVSNEDVFEKILTQAGCDVKQLDNFRSMAGDVADCDLYSRIAERIRRLPDTVADVGLKKEAIRNLEDLPVVIWMQSKSRETATQRLSFKLRGTTVETWLQRSMDEIFCKGESHHFSILHFQWTPRNKSEDIVMRMDLGGDGHKEKLFFGEDGEMSLPLNAMWGKCNVEITMEDEYVV